MYIDLLQRWPAASPLKLDVEVRGISRWHWLWGRSGRSLAVRARSFSTSVGCPGVCPVPYGAVAAVLPCFSFGSGTLYLGVCVADDIGQGFLLPTSVFAFQFA